MLKDRLIATLQRDRLSDFLKEANIQRSGCFYFSLLMCWEKIYPNKVLDRTVANKILSLDQNLSVKDSKVIQRVNELEPLLKLKVVKISIPYWINQNEEEVRQFFSIPHDIPIHKELGPTDIFPVDNNSSGIMSWNKEQKLAHIIALHGSQRFQGLESDTERGNIGGQAGFDLLLKEGFIYQLIFHISASE
jgi:hypothetical protein